MSDYSQSISPGPDAARGGAQARACGDEGSRPPTPSPEEGATGLTAHCRRGEDTGGAAVLECHGLTKVFRQGAAEVAVLGGVELEVGAGDTLAIVGASGSGKSTLLHLLGGLDKPTAGRVLLQGRDLAEVDDAERGRLRNQSLGFVYQFHHLLMEFTAVENVAMPLLIRRIPRPAAIELAGKVLSRVGLDHRLTHRPGELSGGERQRVAVARALVTEPSCLLADEPTGNLDRSAANAVFGLLLELCREHHAALILVTHDMNLAAKAARVLRLQDGVLA